jgi:hypothetical protein
MKKLFTLLFALGAVATSFAQTRDEAKDIILGKKKDQSGTNKPVENKPNDKPGDIIFGKKEGSDDERTYPTSSEQQVRIDQVNREYDAKIQSIRNNPTLTEEEKARAIAQLNKDRARKIREIRGENRTSDKNRKGHDRDEDDDDNGKVRSKNKGNNGNHYGWEKGKGNPHKNGGKPGKKG